MPRAPFQVLVIPYRRTGEGLRFALLHRADADRWQWVAGGGEDGESPEDAARREVREETGIASASSLLRLDSIASIPVECFAEREHWDPAMHVIPEYSFAVDTGESEIRLCSEHRCVEWLDYDAATARVAWDSNRTALWELRRRLERGETDR